MKPLDQNFSYDSFTFRPMARLGDVALLEKAKSSHASPSYEVVILQVHPATHIHGRDYPARESMPPSESWGKFGWTYSHLNAAEAKFRQLAAARVAA